MREEPFDDPDKYDPDLQSEWIDVGSIFGGGIAIGLLAILPLLILLLIVRF